MNMEFTDSEILKIEKKQKIRFSILADINEDTSAGDIKRKRKLRTPDFKVGDVFSVRNKKYIITKAETKRLISVIAKDWRTEGCESPEEAKEHYKIKGFFGERIINGETRFLGSDDFLTYMHSYEFTVLNSDPQLAELQSQQIISKYKEGFDARKLEEKERKKDEAWIKSNPEYFIQIMKGVEISDIKQEKKWRQWEKFSRRKIH